MAEQVFFSQEGMSVTNARVVLGGQTYAMNGVTSVRMLEKKPSRKGAIILGILGLFPLAAGEGGILIGLLMIGAALAWIVLNKPSYIVGLVSASGQSEALSSKDRDQVQKIVDAINEAMIARG